MGIWGFYLRGFIISKRRVGCAGKLSVCNLRYETHKETTHFRIYRAYLNVSRWAVVCLFSEEIWGRFHVEKKEMRRRRRWMKQTEQTVNWGGKIMRDKHDPSYKYSLYQWLWQIHHHVGGAKMKTFYANTENICSYMLKELILEL